MGILLGKKNDGVSTETHTHTRATIGTQQLFLVALQTHIKHLRLITLSSPCRHSIIAMLARSVNNGTRTARWLQQWEQCVAREIKQRNARAGRSTKHAVYYTTYTETGGRGDPSLSQLSRYVFAVVIGCIHRIVVNSPLIKIILVLIVISAYIVFPVVNHYRRAQPTSRFNHRDTFCFKTPRNARRNKSDGFLFPIWKPLASERRRRQRRRYLSILHTHRIPCKRLMAA